MEGKFVEIVREKGKEEMEGKTMKEVILVQVVRRAQSDYYIVDLGANKVRRTPIATLLNEDGRGSTLCSGSVLYNVGGEMSTDKLLDGAHTIDSNHHIHVGASCLELNILHLRSLLKGVGVGEGEELEDNDNDVSNYKWEAAPPIPNDRLFPRSASLGGRVYVLGGSPPTYGIGEVFNPWLRQWEPLNSPPSDLSWGWDSVSYPVIPDEKNQRLLVHFDDVYSLYAYYPSTGEWDCLAKRMLRWKAATALVDDVLYFHIRRKRLARDCISAYDLLTKAWLKVEYSSEFPVEVCISKFLDMLYLGNGMLCLSNSCFFYDENRSPRSLQTNLQFVKFRVERTSPSVVRVTLIAAHCFPFEGYLDATHFILL